MAGHYCSDVIRVPADGSYLVHVAGGAVRSAASPLRATLEGATGPYTLTVTRRRRCRWRWPPRTAPAVPDLASGTTRSTWPRPATTCCATATAAAAVYNRVWDAAGNELAPVANGNPAAPPRWPRARYDWTVTPVANTGPSTGGRAGSWQRTRPPRPATERAARPYRAPGRRRRAPQCQQLAGSKCCDRRIHGGATAGCARGGFPSSGQIGQPSCRPTAVLGNQEVPRSADPRSTVAWNRISCAGWATRPKSPPGGRYPLHVRGQKNVTVFVVLPQTACSSFPPPPRSFARDPALGTPAAATSRRAMGFAAATSAGHRRRGLLVLPFLWFLKLRGRGGSFAGWRLYSPHPWQRWSVLGTA